MNVFEKIIYFLQGEMERPTTYGLYHITWLILVIGIVIYFIKRKNYSEKKLKRILLIYGVGALILEVLKQVSWAFNYDQLTGIVTWKYSWYSAPFQLCTTPIFISLIAYFLKPGKKRTALLSYMAFFTILGSLVTAFYPENCFVRDILVNIHTMYLHMGSLVVSLYLIISGEVKLEFKNLIYGYNIFLIFIVIAQILNISIYNSGILNGETFNMFYISPYFISSLPIFDTIQSNVIYPVYLIIYLSSIFIGGILVYGVAKFIKKSRK